MNITQYSEKNFLFFIIYHKSINVTNQNSLSLLAPYKTVTKKVERTAENKVLLTCQSEGYPKSAVMWTDGSRQSQQHPNTSVVSTPEQLFKITSQILVSASEENNYTCSFSGETSATFNIPGEF